MNVDLVWSWPVKTDSHRT